MVWVWTLGLDFGGFTLRPSKSRGCGNSWIEDWTLGLAFGGFTLCPTKGSNIYILLPIFSPFLWTLNKVWPLTPTPSRLRRPQCEAALNIIIFSAHGRFRASYTHHSSLPGQKGGPVKGK